jgi:pyruvate kinase
MRGCDSSQLNELIHQLELLRAEMLHLEADGLPVEADVHPEHRASARNLLHYLALRRHDIRELQEQLAGMGLSSLGRTESHVISALHNVMDVLAQLAGTDGPPQESKKPEVASKEGQKLLEKNTAGAHHGDHAVRGGRELRTGSRPGGERHELHAHQLRARWAKGVGGDDRQPSPRRAGDRKTLQGLHGRGWS